MFGLNTWKTQLSLYKFDWSIGHFRISFEFHFYFSIFYRWSPSKHHILGKTGNLLRRRLLQFFFNLVSVLKQRIWKSVRILPFLVFGNLLVIVHYFGNFVQVWHRSLAFQIWKELLNMRKLSNRHLIVV